MMKTMSDSYNIFSIVGGQRLITVFICIAGTCAIRIVPTSSTTMTYFNIFLCSFELSLSDTFVLNQPTTHNKQRHHDTLFHRQILNQF